MWCIHVYAYVYIQTHTHICVCIGRDIFCLKNFDTFSSVHSWVQNERCCPRTLIFQIIHMFMHIFKNTSQPVHINSLGATWRAWCHGSRISATKSHCRNHWRLISILLTACYLSESSQWHCKVHVRVIVRDMFKQSFTKAFKKITHLILQPHPPGTDVFMNSQSASRGSFY